MSDNKYGIRIYPISKDVILVKQTIKRKGSPRYVIDTARDGTHREMHVDRKNRSGITAAILQALEGTLG
jgi:hypothetical protein